MRYYEKLEVLRNRINELMLEVLKNYKDVGVIYSFCVGTLNFCIYDVRKKVFLIHHTGAYQYINEWPDDVVLYIAKNIDTFLMEVLRATVASQGVYIESHVTMDELIEKLNNTQAPTVATAPKAGSIKTRNTRRKNVDSTKPLTTDLSNLEEAYEERIVVNPEATELVQEITGKARSEYENKTTTQSLAQSITPARLSSVINVKTLNDIKTIGDDLSTQRSDVVTLINPDTDDNDESEELILDSGDPSEIEESEPEFFYENDDNEDSTANNVVNEPKKFNTTKINKTVSKNDNNELNILGAMMLMGDDDDTDNSSSLAEPTPEQLARNIIRNASSKESGKIINGVFEPDAPSVI